MRFSWGLSSSALVRQFADRGVESLRSYAPGRCRNLGAATCGIMGILLSLMSVF